MTTKYSIRGALQGAGRIRGTGNPVVDLIVANIPLDSPANLITAARCPSVVNLGMFVD